MTPAEELTNQYIEARTEAVKDSIANALMDMAAATAKVVFDQIRSDEAIARLANCLHRLDHHETLDHHEAVCERDRGGCDRRELYTDDARTALAALLGEEA